MADSISRTIASVCLSVENRSLLGAQSRLPGSSVGGRVGVSGGEDGFALGRQGNILGVLSGRDGLATDVDERGNVAVSGGQRLGIWNDLTGINNQAGIRGGQDGFGLGQQFGLDGIFDSSSNLGADLRGDRVAVSGGQKLGILGALFGIGRNGGVTVDTRTGECADQDRGDTLQATRRCKRRAASRASSRRRSSSASASATANLAADSRRAFLACAAASTRDSISARSSANYFVLWFTVGE